MNIYALGLATESSNGDMLEVYFPYIEFGEKKNILKKPIVNSSENKKVIEINCDLSDLSSPIKNIADAYLRLHLLSYKFVLPNSINLEG